MDGGPNRRNKDAFLIFSSVLWTPSQSAEKYVYMNFSMSSHLINGCVELVCSVLACEQAHLFGWGAAIESWRGEWGEEM